MDDPWDWTIDQVVEAVCYHTSPLLDDVNIADITVSDPPAFERSLRDLNVKGIALINELDHQILRDDLSLHSLGDRSCVLHLIRHLRRKSSKYVAQLHLDAAVRPWSLHTSNAQYSAPASVSHVRSWNPEASFLAASSVPLETPNSNDDNTNADLHHHEQPDALRAGESLVVDKAGRKRRRLVLDPPQPLQTATLEPMCLDTSSDTAMPGTEPDKDVAAATAELSLGPSSDIDMPDADCSLMVPTEPSLEPYDVSDPGVRTHSTVAKTRRIRAARTTQEMYSGLLGCHFDKIFYGETKKDQQMQYDTKTENLKDIGHPDEDRDFIVVPSDNIGNGQRLYVNNRFKYFLHEDKVKVQHNGEEVTAIIPYSVKPMVRARKHWRPSMTIFRDGPNGWAAFRVDRPLPKELEDLLGSLNGNNKESVRRIYDPLDPDNLLHWLDAPGGDREIDFDNLSESDKREAQQVHKEMIREAEERSRKARMPLKSSERPSLDRMQVIAILTRALQRFVKSWKTKQEKQAMKFQRKAWRLWRKSEREGCKKAQIVELTARIRHLGERLQKIRQKILHLVWSSEKQVMRQAQSMQQTVFDQEDAKWQRDVLKYPTAPNKPQHMAPKKKAAGEPLKDHEQDLAVDDGASSSSEGSMEDFIDDDGDEAGSLNDETSGTGARFAATLSTADTVDQRVDPKSADAASQNALPKLTGLFPGWKLMKQGLEFNAAPKPVPQVIDLTLSDSPEPEERTNGDATPPLIDWENDSDSSFRRKRKEHVAFKHPLPHTQEVITILDDDLPEYHEVQEISRMDTARLEEFKDRRRLLIQAVARTHKNNRQKAIEAFDNMSLLQMQTTLVEALSALQSGSPDERIPKLSSEPYMFIAVWWVTWSIPVSLNQDSGMAVKHIKSTLRTLRNFQDFHECLGNCLAHYKLPDAVNVTPTKRRVLLEVLGDSPNNSPFKKRKYAVEQSQSAKDEQFKAQERKRQKNLAELKFKTMGVNDEDPTKVIVNIGKEDHHDFIYVNAKIGERIQPHQKDGVQFMWRELTAEHDEDKLQGCLLAHTMGLGKTMQVITLLVTIAEVAKSSNNRVLTQVPPILRKSQTLVLCPPALLDNWYEEFLMWAPDPWANNIGDVRKVSSTMKRNERIYEIGRWKDGGGVLLLGYTTFRDLITNTPRKDGPLLNEEDHQNMTDALLNKPTLIVADEAHTFKNMTSAIWKAMARLKSRSRIALTGSPLSNNLQEYYTVIEWIAPNYLGEPYRFKALYIEPIQEGLYFESTPAEYLEARKRLKALHSDLEPKVHRANLSVLQGRLKGKSEFLIKLPLMELQAKIYRHYVDYMLRAVEAEDPETTTLWAWLEDLRLLCNHPQCFQERLGRRLQEARRTSKAADNGSEVPVKGTEKQVIVPAQRDSTTSDDENEDPVVDSKLPETMTEKLLAIYKGLTIPLDSLRLSSKMLVLNQILDLAEKAGDKSLVFSHSIPTLDYIADLLGKAHKKYMRIDGKVHTGKRQEMTREFNSGKQMNVCLISTKAGGLGLNMYGANRVIIVDTHFNPMHEEQAIGRAYRLGQKRSVYVYRLTVGGTFEEALLNQSLFKQQLATRVVDKKNPRRHALKNVNQYLFHPKQLDQEDIYEHAEKDPLVLGKLVTADRNIRSISLTETFHKEDQIELTPEQLTEVQRLREADETHRRQSASFSALISQRKNVSTAPGQ